jgi:hypothetical protein
MLISLSQTLPKNLYSKDGMIGIPKTYIEIRLNNRTLGQFANGEIQTLRVVRYFPKQRREATRRINPLTAQPVAGDWTKTPAEK